MSATLTHVAVPLAAVSRHFGTTVLVLGLLLLAGALISGMARRSFISLTALFLIAGFALGHGGFGVLELSARGGFVTDLATVALIVLLFRAGLEVEACSILLHGGTDHAGAEWLAARTERVAEAGAGGAEMVPESGAEPLT